MGTAPLLNWSVPGPGRNTVMVFAPGRGERPRSGAEASYRSAAGACSADGRSCNWVQAKSGRIRQSANRRSNICIPPLRSGAFCLAALDGGFDQFAGFLDTVPAFDPGPLAFFEILVVLEEVRGLVDQGLRQIVIGRDLVVV